MRLRLLLFFALVFSNLSQAQIHQLSLGANVAGPAISAEYEVSNKASARVDLGFYLGNESQITINPELHFHKVDNAVEIGDAGLMTPYHGPALVVIVGDTETVVAAEFIWGLEFDINEMPFKVFIDAGPSFQFDPISAIGIASSFGVRYKF